ncbi:MAG TPA: DUF5715 family protein [Vicinamibacterales bacterium]|nr:DUF5715 family protein [Vicinamibacterales bacterium]
MKKLALVIVFLLVLPGFGPPAGAQDPAIYSMVSDLRQQSHADALTIKEEYRSMMDTAMFEDREHLRRATDAGELVLVSTVELSHVYPRLSGQSPIGEKDLEHQPLYVALRPAAMGMLIDITERVQYGSLELTSLVRTAEYQKALMRGNGNANTDVPTHAMGYAIDIGLKFMPPDTATELRRVLEEMRAAGDIYFIAEANQLTFHIVPVPSRIPHFEALYHQTVAAAAQPEPAPEPVPVYDTPDTFGSRVAGIWSWITGLFD